MNSTLPTKTVPEFIAYAKTKPGKLSMASGGIGTPSHVAGELFKIMTGVDIVHVPYRGGAPALTDILAGQVHVYFSPMTIAIGYVKSGMLPALAVTTTTRLPALPGTPSRWESNVVTGMFTAPGTCLPQTRLRNERQECVASRLDGCARGVPRS